MGRFDNLASFSGIQNSFHGLFEQVRRLDTDDGIDAVADWEIIDPYRVIPEDDENPGIAFLEEENAFFKGMVRDAAYLEYKKFRAFLNERGHGQSALLVASGEGPVESEVLVVLSLNENEVAVAAAELSA